MTVKEFYDAIGSDYTKALQTLMNDEIATKYLLRFLDDESMSKLSSALMKNDLKNAFLICHALKGVTANIGLYKLFDSLDILCENLRNQPNTYDISAYNDVLDKYEDVIINLTCFKNEQ